MEIRRPEPRRQRTPAAFLPYQQRWAADKSAVKVIEKSRRIGLSWAEAADDALLAASDRGMDVWYVGYNHDMAREFIEDVADWAKSFQKAASAVEEFVFQDEEGAKDILAFRVRFASGHKVTALSSRPSNLRGKQGKIVLDEAAFHDDLAGLLKAALAMLMWGGRVVVISTHNGEESPFNELVNDIRSSKRPYSLHRVTIDDALREGLHARICLRLGREHSAEAEAAWRKDLVEYYGDDAEEELFCIPSKGSGIYLPRALVEACMDASAPVLRLKCPADFVTRPEPERREFCRDWCEGHLRPLLDALDPGQPCYLGEDFGRSGDLSVLWPLQEDQGLKLRTPFLIEERNVPFDQQREVLFYVCDRLPRLSGLALDARGNGQYMAEVALQRYGEWRVRPVMLSTEWYRDNMPRYKAAFEDRSLTVPLDADVLDDHRAVRMEKGVAQVPPGYKGRGRADGGQRHADTAVAGPLALFAARQIDGGPVEYQSLGRRRLAEDAEAGRPGRMQMRPDNREADRRQAGRFGKGAW